MPGQPASRNTAPRSAATSTGAARGRVLERDQRTVPVARDAPRLRERQVRARILGPLRDDAVGVSRDVLERGVRRRRQAAREQPAGQQRHPNGT
jgi:hypothetical protein